MRDSELDDELATALEGGAFNAAAATERAQILIGRPWPLLSVLAQRYIERFSGKTRPRHCDVLQLVQQDAEWKSQSQRHRDKLRISKVTAEALMRPVDASAGWPIPSLTSVGELADWLGLTPGELEWFADRGSLLPRNSAVHLQHYRYRLQKKSSGGIRLIEAPKPRLKILQRRILAWILNAVPMHEAAHGFRRGRSIQSFATPHAAQRVLLRIDLRDFFPSIPRARVQALFRTLGYPEGVADVLGGMCTNVVPRPIFRIPNVAFATMTEARSLYTRPHLPQGTPTSPAIANACAYRLDCRLTGLARAAGATYTRYADDLAFSGGEAFERRVARCADHVGAILIEEGFEANYRKTRVMRSGTRQHLTGLVANAHLNVPREEFDRLKAILANCLHFSPALQNRDNHPAFREHLEGRVGFVLSINPTRGNKLRAIFDRIDWAAPQMLPD